MVLTKLKHKTKITKAVPEHIPEFLERNRKEGKKPTPWINAEMMPIFQTLTEMLDELREIKEIMKKR